MFKPKKENSTRIEFRAPDSACNPYLAFSVMLAAGLDGVANSLELPDNYPATEMPQNLNEATAIMEKSALVQETLGEHVFDYVLRNKKAEWSEYARQVSAFELDRHLPVL